MNAAIDIFHRLVIPVLGALCIVSLKKLADRRLPSLHDASDFAWCLLMMSVGAMVVSSRGWTTTEYEAKVVADIFLALLLLANRSRKRQRQDGTDAGRGPGHSVGIVGSCGELLIGLTAVLLTSG